MKLRESKFGMALVIESSELSGAYILGFRFIVLRLDGLNLAIFLGSTYKLSWAPLSCFPGLHLTIFLCFTQLFSWASLTYFLGLHLAIFLGSTHKLSWAPLSCFNGLHGFSHQELKRYAAVWPKGFFVLFFFLGPPARLQHVFTEMRNIWSKDSGHYKAYMLNILYSSYTLYNTVL